MRNYEVFKILRSEGIAAGILIEIKDRASVFKLQLKSEHLAIGGLTKILFSERYYIFTREALAKELRRLIRRSNIRD